MIENRRLRLDVAYDGTAFRGWEIQPGLRTVQGVLEATLGVLAGDRAVRLRAAGRTDAGVHARGQVADLEIASRLEDLALARALGRMLPADLRVMRVRTVHDDFHARRDAVAKTYCYRLDRSPAGDPLRARYALHVPGSLDREALDQALARLPGRRDWSGFAGAACATRDRVRRLTTANYAEPTPGEGVFTFVADGFLNRMARNLVGTLLHVARGRLHPRHVDEVLASGDRTLAGPTAPAHGLCLEAVHYAVEAIEAPRPL
jgi:tRNA pseudouridine38-40 synthase